MLLNRFCFCDPTPPPSVPEGATGPNAGNLGPGDLYGFDEKDD